MTGLNAIGKVKETTDVMLTHPVTGDPVNNADGSQMSITIHGPYSKRYKQISHEQQNRRLIKAQRSGGKLNLTAEDLEESSLELLVKCVDGWNVSLGAKPEAFSEDAVSKLFTDMPWVREQVDAAFGDTKAFLE
jgi:hypothetical protein